MVFSYDDYEAQGGMRDFDCDYDSIHDALDNAYIRSRYCRNVNIYDIAEMKEVLAIVCRYSSGDIEINVNDELVLEYRL